MRIDHSKDVKDYKLVNRWDLQMKAETKAMVAQIYSLANKYHKDYCDKCDHKRIADKIFSGQQPTQSSGLKIKLGE